MKHKILIIFFSVIVSLNLGNELSDSLLSFPKEPNRINNFEYGVTIINHGAQFFGSDPFDWMTEMAESIRARAGEARILKYNKSTGDFDELPGYDLQGETILLCDWVAESDNIADGFSESAADGLFAALLLAEKNNNFILKNIHFIGHSRGCSVNSEIVERLLKVGIEVDHVTNLDPHDWGAFSFSDDYDVNPDSLVIDFPASRTPNRGIVSWEGIGWSESYWQQYGFGGRAVYGAYSLQLQNIGHSNVHEWYLGTIDNVSGENSWFDDPYPKRDESGFNYSRVGGLTRPEESGMRQSIIFNFENEGIINGDFRRGPVSNFDEYPGWSEHGGGGNGNIENGRLVLNQTNTLREHNRFYIPAYAEKLKFFYNVSIAETGSPPMVDKFQYLINTNNTGSTYDVLFEEHTISELENSVELDISGYSNSIGTILLQLIEGGGNGINSQIEVDSITFILDTRIRIDITLLLEGSYQSGEMNTGLADINAIPLNQPYSVSPWNYPGNESVLQMPDNVVDWILVELRDKNDNTNILSQRAALLLKTGKVVDLDGIKPVPFSLPPGEYYIGIKHRNHLPIMSSNPVSISTP